MTRDEVVTLLGYRLGSRTDLDAKIILEMDFVQQFVLEGTGAFLPWFLETEMSTSTTNIDEDRLALPDDFLGEIEEQALWLYDADNEENAYTLLIKGDYDQLLDKYPAPGTPKQYAMTGDYFLIRPTPDDNYTIKMRYYAKDDSLLTENIENKWLKHAADLVIAETGTIMARNHLMNEDLAAGFEKAALIARQRLYTLHERRKHTNRTYSMGDD